MEYGAEIRRNGWDAHTARQKGLENTAYWQNYDAMRWVMGFFTYTENTVHKNKITHCHGDSKRPHEHIKDIMSL